MQSACRVASLCNMNNPFSWESLRLHEYENNFVCMKTLFFDTTYKAFPTRVYVSSILIHFMRHFMFALFWSTLCDIL